MTPHASHPHRDLWWVAGATAAVFALGSLGQWQEKLGALLDRYEPWQLDELPLALTVMTLGLAWHAWRRHREAARLLRHNRELARQLIAVQERERQALARELHDELAQHCAAIRLEAAVAERCGELAQAVDAARRAASSAEALQAGVRRLLRQLRPADLDALGLSAALAVLCAQRPWPACRFSNEGDTATSLGEALDIAIYRIAQEALSNALRHAHATAVDVHLRVTSNAVQLSVQDDGLGFDADADTQGLGLLGARERAEALGGRLHVRSAPGRGTHVDLWLPLLAGGGDMTRLLLVDDHPVVRAGYQRLLELGGTWRVVAQAGSVDDAIALHREHHPELTITDLGLPGRGGLELLRHLLERDTGTRVLVFSMHEGEAMVRRAFEMGARGYVTKSSAPEELLAAVTAVMTGRRYLCSGLPTHWLQASRGDPDRLETLSDREFEVFRLLAEGRTPADCAGTLHLSPKTVSNLQTQIRDKLGLASTAAMAHLALRRGLIEGAVGTT